VGANPNPAKLSTFGGYACTVQLLADSLTKTLSLQMMMAILEQPPWDISRNYFTVPAQLSAELCNLQ